VSSSETLLSPDEAQAQAEEHEEGEEIGGRVPQRLVPNLHQSWKCKREEKLPAIAQARDSMSFSLSGTLSHRLASTA
jgi:hypothetical protein